MARKRCNQCEALMIQGMFCHETGCPNTHSRYDSETGEWIKTRECFDCGFRCDADDPCCSATIEDDTAECGDYPWSDADNLSHLGI